jgi:hypothetical protein
MQLTPVYGVKKRIFCGVGGSAWRPCREVQLVAEWQAFLTRQESYAHIWGPRGAFNLFEVFKYVTQRNKMTGEGRIWRCVPSASSGASHGARMYNSRLNYCMWAGVAGMQAVSLGWLMCIFCVEVGFRERRIVLIQGYTENWNMSKLIGTIGTSNFDCICMDHSSKEWPKIAERRRIVSICSLRLRCLFTVLVLL